MSLPSNISGLLVYSETSFTSILLSFKTLYVQPVDIRSIYFSLKFLAKSIIQFLSDTDIKASLGCIRFHIIQ